ncbi:hypothetical protein SAMN05444274_103109 [Mariniphaga anaerophila]|uniref:TonB family C-terminal domain-containing protein n=2 Tax=Mariniphaga anaerophila TaxID=1484053 RepID=A0A1M4XSY1_9BACT|nr:hypothetical protein SAMN05444274_103109 [Mariniphaga anaerophila]
MGTLIFHILLVSVFLLADVDMKGTAYEEELLIEFPELIPEPEAVEETKETQESEPTANEASSPLSETRSNRTNIASNKLAKTDEFFDEDYMREVEAAKQLVSDVNNQLSKEAVNLEDIKMPVKTTEGMNPDSIDNVVYTGESNIVYYLENRYHVSLPIPVYLAQSGGTVVVDIAVTRDGKVIEATPRKNASIRDDQIFLYAKAAASRTIFNADASAPNPQKGTIHYTFVAQ